MRIDLEKEMEMRLKNPRGLELVSNESQPLQLPDVSEMVDILNRSKSAGSKAGRSVRDEESTNALTVTSSNRRPPSIVKRENQVIDVNSALAEINLE